MPTDQAHNDDFSIDLDQLSLDIDNILAGSFDLVASELNNYAYRLRSGEFSRDDITRLDDTNGILAVCSNIVRTRRFCDGG